MFSKGRKKREGDLKEHGKRALGTILESRTGGGVQWNVGNPIGDIGTSHAVRLTINVQPADEPPFEVHWKTRAEDGSIPEAGQTVVVWFDPDDHDRFTVELQDAAAVAEEKFGEFEQRTGMDVGKLIGNPDEFREALQGRPGVNPAEAVREALDLSPEAIQGAMGGAQQSPAEAYQQWMAAAQAAAGGSPAESPEDRLEKLAKLRDSGALTQEEFETQKAKILGSS
jgi:hypothetical protein